jgi:hypothetical protein
MTNDTPDSGAGETMPSDTTKHMILMEQPQAYTEAEWWEYCNNMIGSHRICAEWGLTLIERSEGEEPDPATQEGRLFAVLAMTAANLDHRIATLVDHFGWPNIRTVQPLATQAGPI